MENIKLGGIFYLIRQFVNFPVIEECIFIFCIVSMQDFSYANFDYCIPIFCNLRLENSNPCNLKGLYTQTGRSCLYTCEPVNVAQSSC